MALHESGSQATRTLSTGVQWHYAHPHTPPIHHPPVRLRSGCRTATQRSGMHGSGGKIGGKLSRSSGTAVTDLCYV